MSCLNFYYLAERLEFIPIIANWYYSEWGHEQQDNSVEQTIKRIENKVSKKRIPLHVIVCKDNVVVGVYQLKYYEMEEYKNYRYWLGSVYVAPEYRGTGIGLQLVLDAIDRARLMGIKKLYLSTEKLDGGIYRKAGFKPIEQTISRGDKVTAIFG